MSMAVGAKGIPTSNNMCTGITNPQYTIPLLMDLIAGIQVEHSLNDSLVKPNFPIYPPCGILYHDSIFAQEFAWF